MDSSSFDRLTRLFAASRSRRTLGGAVLGALAGVLGGVGVEAAAAHSPLPACREIKHRSHRRACLRQARAHAQAHSKNRKGQVGDGEGQVGDGFCPSVLVTCKNNRGQILGSLGSFKGCRAYIVCCEPCSPSFAELNRQCRERFNDDTARASWCCAGGNRHKC